MSSRPRPRPASGGRATVEYLKCPLCNMNRSLHSHKGQASFIVYVDDEVVQVRQGGGRAFGFRKVEGGGVRLRDLARDRPEIYENLLAAARTLMAELEAQE